jgi:hypothetical protein
MTAAPKYLDEVLDMLHQRMVVDGAVTDAMDVIEIVAWCCGAHHPDAIRAVLTTIAETGEDAGLPLHANIVGPIQAVLNAPMLLEGIARYLGYLA